MRKKLFYQISTSGRTADINIYGDITGNAELINAWMDTDTGAVSARSIVQEKTVNPVREPISLCPFDFYSPCVSCRL